MRRGGSAGVGGRGGGGGLRWGQPSSQRWTISFSFGVSFFMRFFSLILEGSFLAFFPFLGAFGGPKGGHFLLVFVTKCCFS